MFFLRKLGVVNYAFVFFNLWQVSGILRCAVRSQLPLFFLVSLYGTSWVLVQAGGFLRDCVCETGSCVPCLSFFKKSVN